MRYREIVAADIPALFAVRTVTNENRLSLAELTALGITEETVWAKLAGTYHGWLCEVGGQVTGFAIGDRATGELWVIAVLPAYVGQGIGHRLLTLVEGWLAAQGATRLWLTTDIDPALKAYAFYRQHGWMDDRIEEGLRYMVKLVPPADEKAGVR
jgi:GNAT superfamily N-acetyltransferase